MSKITRSELHSFTPFARILQARFKLIKRRKCLKQKKIELTTSPISTHPTTTIILNDPFEGDINPGSVSGQKLYTLATADFKKEDLLFIAQENVSNIISNFHHDSNSSEWGILVNNINNEDGTKLKLLEDFQDCSLKLVIHQAVVT